MTNLTTAAVVLCPELPSTGLLQSMHDPSIKLDVNEIYFAPGISGDRNTQAISKSFDIRHYQANILSWDILGLWR
jgi:hypothetical protein